MIRLAFNSMALWMISMVVNIVVTTPVTTVSREPTLIVSTVWAKGALGTWEMNVSMISPTVHVFFCEREKVSSGLLSIPAPSRAPDAWIKCLLFIMGRTWDRLKIKKAMSYPHGWNLIYFNGYSTFTLDSQMNRFPSGPMWSCASLIGPNWFTFSQVHVRPSAPLPLRKVHSRIMWFSSRYRS